MRPWASRPAGGMFFRFAGYLIDETVSLVLGAVRSGFFLRGIIVSSVNRLGSIDGRGGVSLRSNYRPVEWRVAPSLRGYSVLPQQEEYWMVYGACLRELAFSSL